MYRIHYTYADTEKDSHSLKFTKSLSDVIWKTKITYSDIVMEKHKLGVRLIKDIPQ